MPGTGLLLVSVHGRAVSSPFAPARALSHRFSFNATSAVHIRDSFTVTRAGSYGTNSALRRLGSGKAVQALREHGSLRSPTSLRQDNGEALLAREFCGITLASLGAGCACRRTDCGALARQSLRLRCSFLRVCACALCHAKASADCLARGCVTPLHHFTPLPFRSDARAWLPSISTAATDPAAMTATRGHLRFIPFRCVKHRRYARCDAHFVRPLRGSRQGGLIRRCDPAGNGCARCHCCHEAPALLTVLVPARLWQCLA